MLSLIDVLPLRATPLRLLSNVQLLISVKPVSVVSMPSAQETSNVQFTSLANIGLKVELP